LLLHILRGALGLGAIVGLAYVCSRARPQIKWRLIGSAMIAQGLLAVILLKFPPATQALNALAELMVRILGYASEGAVTIFGDVAAKPGMGGQIAFIVLPSIIFFGAISALLYHWRVIPWLVNVSAWCLRKILPISGPESIALAANVFLGPIEAGLAIRPYLEKLTRSELFCLMTSGMATIAGGVMVAYIKILGGDSAELQVTIGRQLITASILSAPAAVIAAKLIFPERDEVHTADLAHKETPYVNAFDALVVGTAEGLKLALAIGAILIVFIALVAGVNDMSEHVGAWTGLNAWIADATGGKYQTLSLQFLFGLAFAPMAWLIGVDGSQVMLAGQLLGEKTVLNEFIAYSSLAEKIQTDAIKDVRTIAILTFALCGFSNFAGLGIMIGGLSTMAPKRRAEIAQMGLWSLLSGSLACLMTACWAGIFY